MICFDRPYVLIKGYSFFIILFFLFYGNAVIKSVVVVSYTLELGVWRARWSPLRRRRESRTGASGLRVMCGVWGYCCIDCVEHCSTMNEMLSRSEYLQENVQIPMDIRVFSSFIEKKNC